MGKASVNRSQGSVMRKPEDLPNLRGQNMGKDQAKSVNALQKANQWGLLQLAPKRSRDLRQLPAKMIQPPYLPSKGI